MTRRRNVPEINVTPLVDVVLVLLIIFMVIAPQLEQGVRVELPGVKHPDPQAKTGVDPITLTISADGTLFLDKTAVAPDGGSATVQITDDHGAPKATQVTVDSLLSALQAAHAASPERRLVLKGDMATPYGEVRSIFKQAQTVGFPGIALIVNEKHPAGH